MGNNQFKDPDDILQHVGVKGMKWGVRKKVGDIKERGRVEKDIRKRRKSGEITRKEAKAEQWDNFHNYHMKNPKYKANYEKRIAKGQAPKKAMRGAYKVSQRKKRIAMALATPLAGKASTLAVQAGKEMLSKKG